MTSATYDEPHAKSQSNKAAASGWIGSALEYYDFFIYATAASLIFPQIFFPSGNPPRLLSSRHSLPTALATLLGPLAPCSWALGGDTHGRKTVLILCMFLMGFSTMAVGLLPTYQQVGVLAPVLLVVLRLIQGFAVRRRNLRREFYDSRACFRLAGAASMPARPPGRAGGQILAAAFSCHFAHYMPEEAFNSWGWRIPFLLSFFVIIAGYVIRRKVDETPAFAEESEHGEVPKAPIIQAFTNSWRTCCGWSAWP